MPISSTKDPFFGREHELQILKNLLSKRTASLVVIKGRRRVGKSELILQFKQERPAVYFVGKQAPAPLQVRDFLRAESNQKVLPGGTVIAKEYMEFEKQKRKICKKLDLDPIASTFTDQAYIIAYWIKQKAVG